MKSALLLNGTEVGSAAGTVVAAVGDPLPSDTDPLAAADVTVTTGAKDEWVLALFGHPLAAADQQLAEVVAAQLVLATERNRLAGQAAQPMW